MTKKVTDYTPDAANPNAHTERGYRVLDDSISEVGLGRSIVVDKEGRIIAGNGVHQVAVDNGFEDVIEVESDGKKLVVVKRTDLDLADSDPNNPARRMSYYDNRAGQLGLNWSAEQVLADLNAGVDLDALWHDDELKELLAEIAPENTPQDSGPQLDRAAELQQEYRTEIGQLWQLGRHRLAVGDSTDSLLIDKLMDSVRVNAVITDPPYGQNQPGVPNDSPDNLNNLVHSVVENLPIDNGVIVAFQSPRTFPLWLDAIRDHGIKFERMLWMYKSAQMAFTWRGWILTSESILIGSKGQVHWNEVNPYAHDCYYMSEVSSRSSGFDSDLGWHGSVKPLHVVSDIISRVSYKADTIYDPFGGSGTTLIGCEQFDRICYMVELDPKYAAVIIKRWEVLTGQSAALCASSYAP